MEQEVILTSIKIDVNSDALRESSLQKIKALGLIINSELPLLETQILVRSEEDIIRRALALHGVVANSFGFKKAYHWLEENRLKKFLSSNEVTFLKKHKNPSSFQCGFEGLYVFAWLLGHLEDFDLLSRCPDTLVGLYPNLKVGEPSNKFSLESSLIKSDKIIEQLDLAYCLHWSLVHNRLKGNLSPLPALSMLAERRKVLEWVCSDDDWDDISLDT